MTVFLFIITLILAYLVGSFCSAVIVSRLFNLPDPRTEGSKNPGATNVLRLAGKKFAAIVLITDMLKGFLPVLLAVFIFPLSSKLGFVALAAVLGHMYPLFFKFKGGKGVATALGGFLALNFILGVEAIITWIIVLNLFRYSSLASIVTVLLTPLYSLIVFKSPVVFFPLLLITIFIIYKHRNNITRLMDNNEPKVVFRRAPNQDEQS